MARPLNRTRPVVGNYGSGNPAIGATRMAQHEYGIRDILLGPQIERGGGVVPYQVKLPEIADLNSLSPEELWEILERYGIVESWPEMRMDASAYVQRISQRTWTADTLSAEVDKIVSTETKSGLLKLARKVFRETAVYEGLMGENPDTASFTRVGEGDENMCDSCARLAGTSATLSEHYEIGMPGSASCEGGERCRCYLIRDD